MYNEGARVLRDALKTGLLDLTLYPYNDPYVIKAMANVANRDQVPLADPVNPNTFELLNHPRSERWQEHYFDPIAHPDFATNYWLIELARFVVPKGQIGFVRTLEQVVYDFEGDYYPTNSAYWGSPYSVVADVANLRWYCQLDYYDGIWPVRFNFASVNPLTRGNLPGQPYTELSEIDGLWYGAQSPNTEVKLLVPGHRMLRFFMLSPPTTNFQWIATGRLRGTTQITYCVEAAQNARRSY